MNRRRMLSSMTFAGLAASLPFGKLSAATKKEAAKEEIAGGFKKLQIGDLELYVLTDGFLQDKSTHFAPRADIAALRQLLAEHFRSTEHIDMAMNVPLIKTKDRLILLDTGMGIFADDNTGLLLKSLGAAGFSPDQITDVFISHAHPDHIGGVINEQDQLVFPNAKIFIAKTEHDFWMKATLADFNNSALKKEPEFLNMFIPKVQHLLTTIKPLLNYYDFEKPLYGTFSFQLAPGHTPGLTLTTIQSGNKRLLYVADLVHSDILLFPHPEWGFSGDTDLDLAIASRKKIMEQLAVTKTRALGYHLSWPGVGYTRKDGTAFTWVAEAYSRP
ncbi:MBL fold metallo-hydrolase [Niabella ginsenosidivorans]|uniref:MBL fold metallo-hydrolase n=1 Tax=Niabella ginsenosidivorans TaxID=1176587 RepID=A0A1A9HYZ2_9BACT|nr:MBL fold metallo-hydrolase [Niabella ginsenosidivorans]ANH79701.1 MBL fold metallo-hydrolase [Niabella ginsenosidivorans]